MNYHKNDPHHCKCFRVDIFDIDELKDQLKNLGFEEPLLELNQGQEFGLVLTNGDDKQLHIRVMPNGQIEAEVEPTSSYPFAHLNQKHSYSAHKELAELFRKHLTVSHKKKWFPPSTCSKPIIIEPISPSHVKTIVVGATLGILLVGAVYYLTKNKDSKNNV